MSPTIGSTACSQVYSLRTDRLFAAHPSLATSPPKQCAYYNEYKSILVSLVPLRSLCCIRHLNLASHVLLFIRDPTKLKSCLAITNIRESRYWAGVASWQVRTNRQTKTPTISTLAQQFTTKKIVLIAGPLHHPVPTHIHTHNNNINDTTPSIQLNGIERERKRMAVSPSNHRMDNPNHHHNT